MTGKRVKDKKKKCNQKQVPRRTMPLMKRKITGSNRKRKKKNRTERKKETKC